MRKKKKRCQWQKKTAAKQPAQKKPAEERAKDDEDNGPPHVMPLYKAPQTPLEVATAETFVNTCPCAHSGSPGGEARPPEVNGVP